VTLKQDFSVLEPSEVIGSAGSQTCSNSLKTFGIRGESDFGNSINAVVMKLNALEEFVEKVFCSKQ